MVYWVDERTPLPLPGSVPEDVPGLVAAGGRLTTARLEEAYREGMFPWFSAGQPALWWSPDPRMVLKVADFKLQPSLRKTLRRFLRTPGSEIRFDHDFEAVMKACAAAPREGQDGTWIVPSVIAAYCAWHRAGRTHSVETWVDGELAGGLYFVAMGRMVFGESMFSRRTDASKLALAALVAACRARGVDWIDCQQHTGHLASMGAREVPRPEFMRHVCQARRRPDIADWSYDPVHWGLLDPRLLPGDAGPGEDRP